MPTINTKKEVKSKNFYLRVCSLIKQGHSLRGICKNLDISKQNLHYYTKNLQKKGIIAKKGYGTWEVKKEVKKILGGSETEKPLTNLHALNIKLPILKGKVQDHDWVVKEKLNNWIPKYKNFDVFGGITIKNNNNKSLSVFLRPRNINNINEVDNLARKLVIYVYEFFKKEGVILDIFNCEVKNLNLATEDKEAGSMIHKGERFELDLHKKSEKVFEKDDIDAKAWIDGSPFLFSAETNDKDWKREYLSMPFNIRAMNKNLAYVAENYKSHVEMVEKGVSIFKKLDKVLAKILKKTR